MEFLQYKLILLVTDPNDGKKRPNLILAGIEDDIYTLPLTRTEPKTPRKGHDRWKVEVVDWRDAALDQPSLVQVDKPKVFSKTAISTRDFRGVLSEDDMNRVNEMANKYDTYIRRKRAQAARSSVIRR